MFKLISNVYESRRSLKMIKAGRVITKEVVEVLRNIYPNIDDLVRPIPGYQEAGEVLKAIEADLDQQKADEEIKKFMEEEQQRAESREAELAKVTAELEAIKQSQQQSAKNAPEPSPTKPAAKSGGK